VTSACGTAMGPGTARQQRQGWAAVDSGRGKVKENTGLGLPWVEAGA